MECICCDELLRACEPYTLRANATLTLCSSTETDFEKNITTVSLFAIFITFPYFNIKSTRMDFFMWTHHAGVK